MAAYGFGLAAIAKKKAEEAEKNAAPDWFLNAPDASTEKKEELPEWFLSAPDAPPDPEHIDDEEITPIGVATRLSGLEKQEDRLRALRETYPDATPLGDDNFIFTDPDTGKTHKFNQEGWWPSLNDVAGSMPSAAEVTGSILGGIGGGTVGAAVGSPTGPGAVVPATAGAITGAGLGGASFREAMQDIIQWYNGDQDTRTNTEAAKDFATNAAFSAAGEGIGRGVIAVGKPVVKGVKKAIDKKIIGLDAVDDAARVAYEEAEQLGLKPTLGTITQKPEMMQLEATLMKADPNGTLAKTAMELDTAIGGKVAQTADRIFAKPGTPDSVGVLLKDAAKSAEKNEVTRLQGMYAEFENLAQGQKAIGTNLDEIVKGLQAEKAAMGKAQKLTHGKPLDDAIKHAKAIQSDIQKGVPIEDVRAFRTGINPLAYGKKESPVQKEYFQRIYQAATDDLVTTAKSVSDDALEKMQTADAAFSNYKTSGTKKVLEKAINEQEPTKVFESYSRLIKNSPQKLKSVRDSLVKDGDAKAWDSFRSYHLRQLGQQTTKTGTEFNPSVYVKQIEKMPKESADVLFGPGYLADLKRLQSISAKRANARSVRVETPNILDQVVNGLSRRVGLGIPGKLKDVTYDLYREKLLTNPKMVRELLGLQAKKIEKGFAAKSRDYLIDAATRAGELEAMRGYLDSLGKTDEKR